MYTFIDTMEHSDHSSSLPQEAVSINGYGENSNYIENLIKGYRTLYTSGREALAVKLTTTAVASADGEVLKYMNYPARTIIVGFELKANSASDFRDKFNHLSNILSADEADFVFNDEPGVFFTGIPIADIKVEPGTNNVIGEWQIYCAYPFKRSVNVFEALPEYDEESPSAVFNINYEGTFPAKPIIVAEFAGASEGGSYSEDGDCGFVAFIDSEDNILQFGNPDVIDRDAYNQASTPINCKPSVINTWTNSGGKTHGNKQISGSTYVANISDPYYNKGKGQTLSYIRPSFASGANWHGPIRYNALTGDGALNFEIAITHRLCCNKVTESGSFECGSYNVDETTQTMVAGIVIDKGNSGSTGTVRYIVNGKQVGSDKIDLSYNNTSFGYVKRTKQYYNKKKKKWQTSKIKGAKTRFVYTASNLNTSIRKAGRKVTFKVGDLKERTFYDIDIENKPSNRMSFHFGKNGTNAALHTNAVSSAMFRINPAGSYKSISNVFTAGDILEADTNDASVYKRREGTEVGQSEPSLGALGNAWEDFALRSGVNTIVCAWSEWVDPEYRPSFKLLYNEVFI